MRIKIKKPDVPVVEFKVDRTKLIPCYIPEMEGWNNYKHNVLALILANTDFENGTIYDTRQMAAEIAMCTPEDAEKHRYELEFVVSQVSFDASRKGFFQYEYLGDNKWDYGHYVRYFKSPIKKNKKGE